MGSNWWKNTENGMIVDKIFIISNKGIAELLTPWVQGNLHYHFYIG